MLNRDPTRERFGRQPLTPERLDRWRRVLRWVNLTLVQQAVWPLLIVVAGAPPLPVAATPGEWFPFRAGAPALAALLAGLYLLQHPRMGAAAATTPELAVPTAGLRLQSRVLLLGLAASIAVVRLLVGPIEPAAKLLLFGTADVAAFHLIHFGVVARSFAAPEQGQAAAVGLFALSWGVRDGLLAIAGGAGASPALAFAGGLALGLLVALLAAGLRRWPGGAVPAAATHWLLVYGVFGFAG